MTINFKSLIDISVQTNATKSRYVAAKMMTELLNLIEFSVKTHAIQPYFIMVKTIAKLNDHTIVSAENNLP